MLHPNLIRKYFLLFSILITAIVGMYAQHSVFYQLNDEDDLPSNEIYKVVQDKFGFIWIGCDAGLFRYDRFKFKQYVNSQQNGNSISFLKFDNQDRIWCKNFYGQVYRVSGDSLMIIYAKKTSLASEPQFALDDLCNVWVYNERNIIQYNQDGDSLALYPLGISSGEINNLQYHKNPIYIILTDLRLFKFDMSLKNMQCISQSAGAGIETRNTSIINAKDDLLALIEITFPAEKRYKVFKIDATGLSEYIDLGRQDEATNIYSIYYDNDHLWCTSTQGVFMLNAKSQDGGPMFKLFPDIKVSSMIKDREGMYWFTSLQEGIMVVPNMEVISIHPSNSILTDKGCYLDSSDKMRIKN